MNPDIKKIVTRGGAAIVLLILLILVSSATFTVGEGEQAIKLQFGRPIGDPITEPGLHFKTPFVQEVRYFEKRILEWDGDVEQIPTKGREFIEVDTTARWRIADALKFLTSVQNIDRASSRLNDVLDSAVRDEVSSTDLTDIVRSADWDVSRADLARVVVPSADDEASVLTRAVKVGRGKLEERIREQARKVVPQYGIELVDVKIKRLDYIEDVERRVFERMISERQRIAAQFRSEGEGEANRIRGSTSEQLAEIQSEARRAAEVIRGKADAEATKIYNEAYGADPEFYGFLRTLQSYQDSLGGKATLILGADSAYLKYLKQGADRPAATDK